MHVSPLGLGTVQFGAAYGITNRDGQPSEAEIAAILSCACETGMGFLDTAASYADAETLIGRHLPGAHRMRIVTKLLPIEDDVIGPRHVEKMLNVVATSLERLRTAQVHGLLIHQVRDLTKAGWEYLIDALQQAQLKGLTEYIGVSVYDENDLALVLK